MYIFRYIYTYGLILFNYVFSSFEFLVTALYTWDQNNIYIQKLLTYENWMTILLAVVIFWT